jgi:[acyl-carrier-protein] S-malonyltransferase
MSKLAFVFPGQGSQYVGMGKELAESFDEAAQVFAAADDICGYKLSSMCFEGPQDLLNQTKFAQPAILVTSLACLSVARKNGLSPVMVSGLSLGEYTAHVAAESLVFSDAVKLVRRRGKYMQEAVPIGIGTMAAILGLDSDVVIECCKEASDVGVVEPANFNCPGQIVIAGEIKAVEKAVEIAISKGSKRSMILPVSAPFHCSMLKPAGEKLAIELEKVQLYNIKIPLITNVTADYVNSKDEIKDLLIKQVSSPVRWEDSIKKMISDGVGTFVEIGPGKVLSGFIKKIDRKLKCLNVENIDSLEKTAAFFKGE